MTLFEAITLICKKSTQNSHFGAIFPVFIRYSHLPCSDTLARHCLVYHSQRDGSGGGYALRPKYYQIPKSKNDLFSKSIAYYQTFPLSMRFFGVFLVFRHTIAKKYCVLPNVSFTYAVFWHFFGIPTYHLHFTYLFLVLRNTASFPYLRGILVIFWYSDIRFFAFLKNRLSRLCTRKK